MGQKFWSSGENVVKVVSSGHCIVNLHQTASESGFLSVVGPLLQSCKIRVAETCPSYQTGWLMLFPQQVVAVCHPMSAMRVMCLRAGFTNTGQIAGLLNSSYGVTAS